MVLVDVDIFSALPHGMDVPILYGGRSSISVPCAQQTTSVLGRKRAVH